MTELEELTHNLSLEELKTLLSHQINQGENEGGAICSFITDLIEESTMQHARVTYKNGDVINTSINGTDQEIREYFKIGRVFNIGTVNDNLQSIVKCEIIK